MGKNESADGNPRNYPLIDADISNLEKSKSYPTHLGHHFETTKEILFELFC